MSRCKYRGFTLIELLVVIAIIATLIALLLPAIQSSRESARRAHCINNMKQLALGCNLHLSSRNCFPSGGWGYGWLGEAGGRYGKNQPGAWTFSILPFIEQMDVHEIGAGTSTDPSGPGKGNDPQGNPRSARYLALLRRVQIPMPLFICPTRRDEALTPPSPSTSPVIADIHNIYGTPADGANSDTRSTMEVAAVAKTDYVGNTGSSGRNVKECCSGPMFVATGDQPLPPPTYENIAGNWFRGFGTLGCNGNNREPYDGVIFIHSETTANLVKDGLSRTYLLGEKHVVPNVWKKGAMWVPANLPVGTTNGSWAIQNPMIYDEGDEKSMYCAAHPQTLRTAYYPPIQDGMEKGLPYSPATPSWADQSIYASQAGHAIAYRSYAYGSAHSGSFNMAFCDGSVHSIPYDVDPRIHGLLASKSDGNTFDETLLSD